jgi:hypothetical protein
MDKKELKKLVFDKLLEVFAQQQNELIEKFMKFVREIDEMDCEGLEQMNKDLDKGIDKWKIH